MVQTPAQFLPVEEALKIELAENNAVAASIAIYQDGEIVFNKGYGVKAVNASEEVDETTLFQIGSTTKMLTATAILRAVEQGKLSLDDKLIDQVPGINYTSSWWQDISIRDLLTHQTGLEDEYDDSHLNQELVDFLTTNYPVENGMMNQAGKFFNYSNPNYSYLGAVLEQVYNTEYAQVMQQQVFQPLNMSTATVEAEQVETYGNFALGALSKSSGYSALSQVPHSKVTAPAGENTWMTSADLIKVAEFLIDGNESVLPLMASQQLTEKQIDIQSGGLPFSYGFGVFVNDGMVYDSKWYPGKVWHHGGNSDGYTSTFWILPEANVAVAILSSGEDDDFTNSMFAAVESVVDLPAPQEVPLVEVDQSDYVNYVGRYYAGDVEVLVSQQEDILNLSIPEFDENGLSYDSTIYPYSDRSFFILIEDEPMELTFIPEGDNPQAMYMRTRSFVAIREGN